ncbi:RNA methyltransferase [Cellulomonas marina]|uniref:Putative RNA methylase family UPF0020 n=1 Tax=Cellulomonas marina TaxID=988821 RepID=A0A1I0YF71_9CELL|nr:RNA methyltransferase [Cellulomonas marina]GIG28752.1 hypothetical protein Cma02nite_13520 [Cellulomonas marina]SFB11457.1 Putative RNA methylase family UPF0020 [Cellulomonas marina]
MPTTRLELTFLPGLGGVVHDEVVERLAPARPPRPVPGREDALVVDVTGPLRPALALRTPVAAWVALHLDVPRPRSLVSGDHLARVVGAVRSAQLAAAASSLRLEAAGKDSLVLQRLAAELSAATGLPHDPRDGELVVRLRRGVPPEGGAARTEDPGWDVLVRIGRRPLSARPWRVVDYPGAANATIAAALVRLAGVRPQDRVLNLMGGSGTLLVERLLAGPAAAAALVDTAAGARDAARANLAAAGLVVAGAPAPPRRVAGAPVVAVVDADATDSVALAGALTGALTGAPTGTPAGAPPGGAAAWDLVLADPPWGTLHGTHATAADVHAGLLRGAAALTVPGGRLAVLTHEVRVMERCVAAAAADWRPAAEPLRVFAKGHHPRIWVLERRGGTGQPRR